MRNLQLWYIRHFKIINIKKANQLHLKHFRNIYGDGTNHLNCRSLWIDNSRRIYRVRELLITKTT